jgi:mono/diheme cytochrome c family protein
MSVPQRAPAVAALARFGAAVALVFVLGAAVAHSRRLDAAFSDGWQIPADAAAETSPVPSTPVAIAKGKQIFKAKCQRCHGAAGKGDGPEADPDHRPGDLTDAGRASRNPDGVMFYKIWNGRAQPRMPALKMDLSRDEVWTVVHYVKTLRQPDP